VAHATLITGTGHLPRSSVVVVLVASAAVALAVAGYPAIGVAATGGLMTWVSLAAGRRVVHWFDSPHDEGVEVWWNLLLVGLVLVGLAGLGMMALTLPD
jgi:hypothetical protein